MKNKLNVLIVDDSEGDAELLYYELRLSGYEVNTKRVDSDKTLRLALELSDWDVITLDHLMPGFSSKAALKIIREYGKDIPVLIVSGVLQTEEAVMLMKAGAHDFVQKSDLPRLASVINRQMEEAVQRRKSREAEEKLRKTEASLKRAQQIARLGSWEWDVQNNTFFCSDELYRILGCQPEEFEADFEKLLKHIHPDDKDRVMSAFDQTMNNHKQLNLDHRIILADKTVRIVHQQAEVECSANGKPQSMIGIIQDITELKQKQEELEAHKNNLEQKVQKEIKKRQQQERIVIQQSKLTALDEMIGNIAHQWRQPLNALSIIIQDIKDAYVYGELDKSYLDQSVSSSMDLIQKMSSSFNDFCSFFKPDTKKVVFNVKDAVKNALTVCKASLQNKSIRVETHIIDDVTVRGYLNEYSQVIFNIISNSKDALDKKNDDNKFIKIEIDKTDDGRSRVQISDNGGGIDDAIFDKIFEPYFTTKFMAEGAGIGLYIAKMIIEKKLGGMIYAENIKDGVKCTVVV